MQLKTMKIFGVIINMRLIPNVNTDAPMSVQPCKRPYRWGFITITLLNYELL